MLLRRGPRHHSSSTVVGRYCIVSLSMLCNVLLYDKLNKTKQGYGMQLKGAIWSDTTFISMVTVRVIEL